MTVDPFPGYQVAPLPIISSEQDESRFGVNHKHFDVEVMSDPF